MQLGQARRFVRISMCRGARERLALLVPPMNEVVKSVRSGGVNIIHSPASAAESYAGTPARHLMASP